jgi:hypothetical protein
MKALMLTLLLFYSCSKYAEVSKESVAVQIYPVTMGISHLNQIEWRVGKNKEAKVGQSITFIVDMPKLRESDLDFLIKNKKVDSWILRLVVNRGAESQDLGSLYTKFRPRKVSRTSQTRGSPSSVTFKVFYAAAYASERFRAFDCPAFSHNKKINGMEIQGKNQEFSLSLSHSFPYKEKSHQVELTPSAFNGGNSLVGVYYVEIAPYNSREKMIHADFKRIPMSISVNSEESIRIQSCDGVHPELQ